MKHNPWRLAGPTVSVDLARSIHDVSAEITNLTLDSMGHAELWGCLRAAGAAVEQCARIAMRDVDHAAVPTKAAAVPKKKARRK